MTKSPAASGSPPGHIPSLDGIRAVAVGLVVVAHAGYGNVVPGGLGVTIFFFLSGYLITTLFYRELRSRQARGAANATVDLPAFYLRRILRLSPPLLVSLALGYGLLALGLAEGKLRLPDLASQILYFANYYQLYGGEQGGVRGQSVLWSLAVEEHFYLIYPVFFIFLMHRRSLEVRLACIVAFLVATLLWRIALVAELGPSNPHLYYATDARLDSIMYGCLLAVLSQEGALDGVFPPTQRAAIVAQLSGVGVVLFTLLYRDETFRDTARYSLQGIALLPLFYYAIRLPGALQHRVLNLRPLRAVGEYSYSIYLVHHVVIQALQHSAGVARASYALVLGAAFSLAYAWVVYGLVEAPIKRVRQRLHHRRR